VGIPQGLSLVSDTLLIKVNKGERKKGICKERGKPTMERQNPSHSLIIVISQGIDPIPIEKR